MSFPINLKKYFIHFICLIGLFAIALFFQEKYTFEDGAYTRFTKSIIEDGDFNLINQTHDEKQNWLATQTGSHPNYEHSAISVYLFPFILFQKIYSIDLSVSAHILATIFYLMLGLILLNKLLDHLGINHSRASIVIMALSTPFLWFSLFSSTSSNIFSLVYSIVVFSLVLLTDKKSSRIYFFLGFATTLGIAIRIQQFWIIALALYLFSEDKDRNIKKALLFFSGAIIPLALFICNLYLRSGNFSHPHNIYTRWTHLGEFWNTTLPFALWGPNGYLTLSPIYLIIFLGTGVLLIKRTQYRKLLLFMALPPLALFVYYSTLWPLMDSLTGRHQLDYFLIYALMIGVLLDQAKDHRLYYKGLWLLILASMIWNFRTHLAYYYVDNTNWQDWQFYYFVHPKYLNEQLVGAWNLINTQWNFQALLYFIPLIVPLSFITLRVASLTRKDVTKFCRLFLTWGLTFYFIFTHLSITNTPRNVESYRKQKVYESKVITSGDAATFYDDFIETHHRALRWHLGQNDCQTVQRLIEIKDHFLATVKAGITYDPINFVSDLDKGILRRSYLEGQNLNLLYKELVEKCHLSLKTVPLLSD